MTESMVLQLGRDAAVMTLMLAGPLLGVSLVVGVLISVFQTLTQINEMTLTYVPKIFAIGAVLALLGSWMLAQMVHYLATILQNLPTFAR